MNSSYLHPWLVLKEQALPALLLSTDSHEMQSLCLDLLDILRVDFISMAMTLIDFIAHVQLFDYRVFLGDLR